jgi:hypothetical protein
VIRYREDRDQTKNNFSNLSCEDRDRRNSWFESRILKRQTAQTEERSKNYYFSHNQDKSNK